MIKIRKIALHLTLFALVIFVVGIRDEETDLVNLQSQLGSIKDNIELDYLFKNCMPEFSGGTLDEWLNGKENVSENIEKSIDIIRHHPLVPSNVKVHGFMINKIGEKNTVVKIPTNKKVENMNQFNLSCCYSLVEE